MAALPPLRSLHPDSSLSRTKLDMFEKQTSQQLVDSLKPGQVHSLRAKRDGTIMEGHHRIKVLRDRGVDVDSLPRETV